MTTLARAAALAPPWAASTGITSAEEKFSYPYLGAPWEHRCEGLRSERLSVSVIVPVWNAALSIKACLMALSLSSLNRHAPARLEVIVCDDGSTDNSWDEIVTAPSNLNLRAFRLPHVSQSSALNYGLIHASGDVVIFCDADMVLGCGALDELVARHERWSDAVCFGFRTDIHPDSVLDISQAQAWHFMHREALSGDNRVAFDVPTLVPNMLDATNWLTDLRNGKYVLDSQGDAWHRHRFVYGCLFSAQRDLAMRCGGFPDSLFGWGYGDTLLAARMEAEGAFLLPVASAGGLHVHHEIRHPDQWFQGSRNRLAYAYFLDHGRSTPLWRMSQPSSAETTYQQTATPDARMMPTTMRWDETTLFSMSKWEECLEMMEGNYDNTTAAACLFHLGRYEECVSHSKGRATLWAALSHYRLGSTAEAAHALNQAQPGSNESYALTSSLPELMRLHEHFEGAEMITVSQIYREVAQIRAHQLGLTNELQCLREATA